MDKTCSCCKQKKPESEFYQRRKGKQAGQLFAWCKVCMQAHKRKWADENPDKVKAWHDRYYAKYQEREKAKARKDRQELKRKVVSYYSKSTMQCAHCKEGDLVCLCIDHIDGNGQLHRRSIGRTSGAGFYQWLIQNNYPEGFQVLCYNCNMRKRWKQQGYGTKE